MDEALRSIMVHVEVVLPYSEASTLSQVRRRVMCVCMCVGMKCVGQHDRHKPSNLSTTHQQIHDRGSCDKVVYQADGTFVAARVPHVR